jgi:formyltetrahydrofolate-dependent phosphoribosylglycinamide formyltransferase
MTTKLAVLVSGSGTNLQAIMDAIEKGELTAEIVLVASNRKAAYGLIRAETTNIPTLYHPLKPYLENGQGRKAYDSDLAEKIQHYQPDLVVLAGWMHVLSHMFLEHFPDKVINLHPALPGAFAGTDAIERTFNAFQKGDVSYGGCMVHYVVPEVDAGPVIAQATVPLEPDDTLESFETRIHEAEHGLIIEAIRIVSEGNQNKRPQLPAT